MVMPTRNGTFLNNILKKQQQNLSDVGVLFTSLLKPRIRVLA